MPVRGVAMVALGWILTSCSGPAAPPLVLLVSVDTLRADHLGAYGSPHGATPGIDALARESLRFRAAYAPASHTLPSLAALWTGRYPEELGVWSNESRLPDASATLATRLRAEGWRTAAVVSNWVLRSGAGLEAGFDHYDDALPVREASRPVPERRAPATTDAALAALDRCSSGAGARCLLWVHYQDPHGPYTPPAALRERALAWAGSAPDAGRRLPLLAGNFGLGGIPFYQRQGQRRDVAFYRAGYAGEVAHLDAELTRLLAGLRERGLWEQALVVFTADHGESLGENDSWFSHGEFLSDAEVRVPLLLRAPGLAAGVRDDTSSLLDLLPTLLARVGAPPAAGTPGRDLLAPAAAAGASAPYLATLRGSAKPRLGLVAEGYKLVLEDADGVWRARLWRRDEERAELAAAAPQLARRMRARLLRLRAGLARPERETLREPAPEDREKLRALGYLEEGS